MHHSERAVAVTVEVTMRTEHWARWWGAMARRHVHHTRASAGATAKATVLHHVVHSEVGFGHHIAANEELPNAEVFLGANVLAWA